METLRKEMGASLETFIDQWGDKADFAKEAGINRATLYRLLDGKNAGTDTLFRVLRTLGRYEAIELLLESLEETPIQKLALPENGKRSLKTMKAGDTAVPELPVFEELKLGKKKQDLKDD